MRLFSAVVVDENARASAARVLADLAATGADYKWVEPKNLHLTLRFYGERKEAELDALKAALAKAAVGYAPFDMEFARLGAFDRLSRPKILWLGLSKGEAQLAGLAKALGEEREFSAHLTLGRQRSLKNLGALTKLLSSYEFPPFSCRVERLVLMRSVLSGAGPKYAEIWGQALDKLYKLDKFPKYAEIWGQALDKLDN